MKRNIWCCNTGGNHVILNNTTGTASPDKSARRGVNHVSYYGPLAAVLSEYLGTGPTWRPYDCADGSASREPMRNISYTGQNLPNIL